MPGIRLFIGCLSKQLCDMMITETKLQKQKSNTDRKNTDINSAVLSSKYLIMNIQELRYGNSSNSIKYWNCHKQNLNEHEGDEMR